LKTHNNMKILKKQMKLEISVLPIITALSLAAAPSLHAQSCCAGQSGNAHDGCPMGAMAAADTHAMHGGAQKANSSVKPVFMEPVQSVYDGYFKAQGALAQDSLEGVSATASAMAKAIQGDSMKMLPPKVARQAEALAKAKTLAAARDALKPLSDSLIQYWKDQKPPATAYYVAYCPMAKASWLQTDKTIMNPYMGKAMIHCGEIKN
jgi:hypothetical protein